MISIWKRKP